MNCYHKDNSVVYAKAFAFAVRIVKANKYLCQDKKEYVLAKQLLRSGTSIGANISEANGAISVSDFSHKISIAYKEALETKYWLDLLKETEYITEKIYASMFNDVDEIARLLYAILKNTRIDKEKQENNTQ